MGSTAESELEPVLEARGINKHFGPVQALKNVDLSVFPGEVVALIGDNGAGKSTLINVLTGVLPLETGEIIFAGEHVRFSSPHEARAHGIETVYQDLAVAPHLDAVANIFLGRERRQSGLPGIARISGQRRMRKETDEQLSRLRVRVPDLERRLVTLSGGQRQGVAVARAVMWASKVVIMDEPTAALGVAQTAKVLDLIRQVRDTGIPVVFISHNMPNVFQVADRIVVLRLGEVVTELDPKTATIEDAVAAMTGSTRFANREVAKVSAANEAYDELVTEVLPARQRYLSQIAKSFTLLILFAIIVDFRAPRGSELFQCSKLQRHHHRLVSARRALRRHDVRHHRGWDRPLGRFDLGLVVSRCGAGDDCAVRVAAGHRQIPVSQRSTSAFRLDSRRAWQPDSCAASSTGC